jgi:hypothetical protein
VVNDRTLTLWALNRATLAEFFFGLNRSDAAFRQIEVKIQNQSAVALVADRAFDCVGIVARLQYSRGLPRYSLSFVLQELLAARIAAKAERNVDSFQCAIYANRFHPKEAGNRSSHGFLSMYLLGVSLGVVCARIFIGGHWFSP